MSKIKELFNSEKSTKLLENVSQRDVGGAVESADYLKSNIEDKKRFIPHVDFSSASNFAVFGSAENYYEDAYNYVLREYPYDGSLKEKINWSLSGTYLDRYIFENEYPRTTGYINFGLTYTEGMSAHTPGGYDTPTNTSEYISFKGHNIDYSLNVNENPNLTLQFDNLNIYNTASQGLSNLQLEGSGGVSVEFWLDKQGFVFADECQRQVITDIWNNGTFGTPGYGRFRVEISGTAGDVLNPNFHVELLSGTAGFSSETVSDEAPTIVLSGSTLTGSWNHFAITVVNDGTQMTGRLYTNGALDYTHTAGTSIGLMTGTMEGQIGSLITSVSGAGGSFATAGQGDGKLSGSLDEFRFWKTRRTNTQIGKYWFTQVGGGTNTDLTLATSASTKYSYENPVDLGVYYKFNEGIINTSSIDPQDAIVIDFAGRATNGQWSGYTVAGRNTGSAMVSASAAPFEFPDPILYSSHPLVAASLTDKKNIGKLYDATNNSSMYGTLPNWITSDDQNKGNSALKNLTQIMSSYFDSLYLQIKSIPGLKNKTYISGSDKPYPFINRFIDSSGFLTSEVFSKASELEYLDARNDKKLFVEKVNEIKNLIYQNIYNNLVYIYKTKGTEKSFRNLIRGFGIDKELVNIKLYGDEVSYQIRDNYDNTTVRKRYVDFHAGTRLNAVVYQQTASNNSFSQGYISSSAEVQYRGNTYELESFFPKDKEKGTSVYFNASFQTASIFGCHTNNSARLLAQTTSVGGNWTSMLAGGGEITYGTALGFGTLSKSLGTNSDTETAAYVTSPGVGVTIPGYARFEFGEQGPQISPGSRDSSWGLDNDPTANINWAGQWPYTCRFGGGRLQVYEAPSGVAEFTDATFFGVITTPAPRFRIIINYDQIIYQRQWPLGGVVDAPLGDWETFYTSTDQAIHGQTYYPKINMKNIGMEVSQMSWISGSMIDWVTPDVGQFQVRSIRPDIRRKAAYFQLTCSNGGTGVIPNLTSSVFQDVYDGSRWNFAVRVKPKKYPLAAGVSGSSTGNYDVEFSGYNYVLDILNNSFVVTASLEATDAQNFLKAEKRFFVGAHRTNTTGAVLQQSNVKSTSLRVWMDYLTSSVLQVHAKDVTNFGTLHPYRDAYITQFGASQLGNEEVKSIPELETLILNWDFATVTSSDAGGNFTVQDTSIASSGSLNYHDRWGWLGPIGQWQHTGYGFGFPVNDTGSIDRRYVHTLILQPPETINSSNMVSLIDEDQHALFSKDSRPEQYFFAFEKSMYGIITQEMLDVFGTIVAFNNLIGEPVNRYRQEYKNMEKLRQLYFERVQNTPDLDKFVEYFKWLDSAIALMLQQLVPGAARFSENLRTMVESHILERNKYWSKFPTLEMMQSDPEAGVHGITEMLYPWKFGSAPVSAISSSWADNDYNTDYIYYDRLMAGSDETGGDWTENHQDTPPLNVTGSVVFIPSSSVGFGSIHKIGANGADTSVYGSRPNSVTIPGYAIFEFGSITAMGNDCYYGINADPGADVPPIGFEGRWVRPVHGNVSVYEYHPIPVYTDSDLNATAPGYPVPLFRIIVNYDQIIYSRRYPLGNIVGNPLGDWETFYISPILETHGTILYPDVAIVSNSATIANMRWLKASVMPRERHCYWWKNRAERNNINITSYNTTVDEQRNIFRDVDDFRSGSGPTLAVSRDSTATRTTYEGQAYALRNFTKIYKLGVDELPQIHGGSNVAKIKNVEYAHAELPFDSTTQLKVFSSEIEGENSCKDIIDPNKKVKVRYKLTNNPNSYASGPGDIFAPFSLYNSSVNSGYALEISEKFRRNTDITNYHDDVYGDDKETPMQGPFSEKYVGGREYRHVPYWTPSGSRLEAWNLNLPRLAPNEPAAQAYAGVPPPPDLPGTLYNTQPMVWENLVNMDTTPGASPCTGLFNGFIFRDSDAGNCWANADPIGINDAITFRPANATTVHVVQAGLHTSSVPPEDDKSISLMAYSFYMSGGADQKVYVYERGIDTAWFWDATLDNDDFYRIIRGSCGAVFYQHSTDSGVSYNTVYTSSYQTTGDLFPVVTSETVANINNGLCEATRQSGSGGFCTLTFTPRTVHQPRSTILREPLAKRPVNIRNIRMTTGSTIIGNYSHTYQVIQTSGRQINNRFFVKNEGFKPSISNSTWIDGLVDYALPRYDLTGSNQFIFVERFSAPGGPEVNSRGSMDINAEEYSVYNEINQRNLIVRKALQGWQTDHCGQFGILSVSGTNEGYRQPRWQNYNTLANYHKVNRNPKQTALVKDASREVEWVTLIGCSLSDFNRTITTSVTTNWDSFAKSNQILGTTGYFEVEVSHITNNWAIGIEGNNVELQNVPSSVGWDYTILWNGSVVILYERTVATVTTVALGIGDKIRIFRDKSTVYFQHLPIGKINWINIGLAAASARGNYYPQFAAETSVATITNARLSNPQYDNWFIQHPIPRSALQYAWINDSYDRSKDQPLGYVGGCHDAGGIVPFTVPSGTTSITQSVIQFVSASDWGFPGITNGVNYPVNFTNMLSFLPTSVMTPENYKYLLNTSRPRVAAGWYDLRNLTLSANGKTLTKTMAGASSWDGAAAGQVEIDSNGYIEFTADQTNAYLFVGLNDDPPAQWTGGSPVYEAFNDMEYSIELAPDGKIVIWENGVYLRSSSWTYAVGWKFRITRLDNNILYQHDNGTNTWTTFDKSTKTVTKKLLPDISICCLDPNVAGSITVSNIVVNVEPKNTIAPGVGYWEKNGVLGTGGAINSYFNNINGPYGYPSWKQIRTGETPVARYHKRNNILSIQEPPAMIGLPNPYGTGDFGFYWKERPDTFTNFVEPPVTFKYRALDTGVVSDGQVVTLRSTYANNKCLWTEGISVTESIAKFRRELNHKPNSQIYDKMIQDPDIRNTIKSLSYKEIVYPRGMVTGLAETRGRTAYAEVANGTYEYNGTVLTFSASLSDGINGIDRQIASSSKGSGRRTFWRDAAILRNRRKHFATTAHTPPAYLITGTLPNSQGQKDGQATSVWPFGSTPLVYFSSPGGPDENVLSGNADSAAGNPGMYPDTGELNSCTTIKLGGFPGTLEFSNRASAVYPLPAAQATWFPTASAYYHHLPKIGSRKVSDESDYQKPMIWKTDIYSGKKPWFDSYEDYANDIRGKGKSFTIIPEFRMSDHMSYYVEQNARDFKVQNDKFLSLNGANITSSADTEWENKPNADGIRFFNKKFFNEYSNSDFQKYFGKFYNERKPDRITLKCRGIKKLLPYNGFYPQQRTLQLASMFSQSLGPYISGLSWSVGAPTGSDLAPASPASLAEFSGALAVQSMLQPYFAPGILYNTIKSGIAVNWSAYTGSTLGAMANVNEFGAGMLTTASNYVIPFESLLDPLGDIGFPKEKSIHSKLFLLLPTYASGGFTTGVQDPAFTYANPRLPYIQLTESQARTDAQNPYGAYGLYQLAMSNLLAEIPNFFLNNPNDPGKFQKIQSVYDASEIGARMNSSKRYYLDIYLEQDSDLIMTDEYWNGTAPNSTININGRLFGPPNQVISNSLGAGVYIQEAPAYAPYTPPHFYGKSKVTISYEPTADQINNFNFADFFDNLTASFRNDDLIETFENLNTLECGDSNCFTSSAQVGMMTISSSINFEGIFREDGKASDLSTDQGLNKWVISPRMETPVLDFSSQPYLYDTDGAPLHYPRGMWSGYGVMPEGKSLRFGIEDTFTGGSFDTSLTGSLVDVMFEGITPINKARSVGQMATSKEISEAIVAIPYLETLHDTHPTLATLTKNQILGRRFFSLGNGDVDASNIFTTIRRSILEDGMAISSNILDFALAYGITEPKQENSISDLVLKMNKYQLPPELDFNVYDGIDPSIRCLQTDPIERQRCQDNESINRTKAVNFIEPFVMYIMEFTHQLSRQDLIDIWQGLMPKISTTAEEVMEELDWPNEPLEFFGGKLLPPNIRWMVFKIKKRANFDYYSVTPNLKDDQNTANLPGFSAKQGKIPYSYNWPYDYFSLVELAELEVDSQGQDEEPEEESTTWGYDTVSE